MNRTIATLALVAAAAAGNAFADDITVDTTPFNSTKTRAEVQADVVQFKKGPNVWSTQYNPLAKFRSATTRDAVTAAYVADRGQVAALTGEDSGSAYLTATRAVNDSTRLAGQSAVNGGQ